jgi:hypothetical protein
MQVKYKERKGSLTNRQFNLIIKIKIKLKINKIY